MESIHSFHIPVMGTGHSADTPIRVAHLGISSVISLVDDLLLERLRKHYCEAYGLAYRVITRYEADGRARRITAYLEAVREIVGKRMDAVRGEPFGAPNEKTRYFELLPAESPLARDYAVLKTLGAGPEREGLERDLTARMRPGSIDVNIMVKLDRINFDREGAPMSDEFNDAKAALRGYAVSSLESSLILSAGMNQGLFTYMAGFRDFYRDETGRLKKRIIIKVSDFRSALIQGKVLAKKGLEVHEFRIESGLNCGGHAFASNGFLLPHILREFQASRPTLSTEFRPLIQKHYEKMGWPYPESARSHEPLVTVQGGIGTHGEVRRLREGFGMDLTGWASPFLLVPEATCVDDPTRELLRRAEGKDLYLSDVSPLGVPFNNVRGTGSETWTQAKVDSGTPGSACPSGFLAANTEFSEKPLCTAGRDFQGQKLAQIEAQPLSIDERNALRAKVVQKTCICSHLGNGALIALGIVKETGFPQSICPGPNIAWFDRLYTLEEMVGHIYGKRSSLVSLERPHMFAAEIVLYVDYFEKLLQSSGGTPQELKTLQAFRENLEEGMRLCVEIAGSDPYADENLASIVPTVERQRARLKGMVPGGLHGAGEGDRTLDIQLGKTSDGYVTVRDSSGQAETKPPAGVPYSTDQPGYPSRESSRESDIGFRKDAEEDALFLVAIGLPSED